MKLENDLKNETEKWLKRIKEKKYILKDNSKERLVKNMEAYIKDSEIYLKENKLIMSFEAVVWAWSIYELLLELDIMEELE